MKSEAQELYERLIEACRGATMPTVLNACASLISRVYVQHAKSVDDVDKELDEVTARIKQWVRDNWDAHHVKH